MKTIICNWKMNPQSLVEAKQLFDATKKIATKYKDADIVIAPPALFLSELVGGYRGSRVEFAAQNIFWEQSGSYTGEVSATQVRNAGATYALIGHAERRALGDTDEDVRAKVAAALAAKLDPIVAIGESQRDAGAEYITEVRTQIVTALADVPVSKFKNITIAYEPVWAIGAEKAPDGHAVHQMMLLVRKTVADVFGEKAMRAIRVVYGGSVNNENAEDILSVPDLQGVLVGRASLDPHRLDIIARIANTV